MANLDTRTILTHRFAQTVFYCTLVANRGHVDEVDNNQTTQVAQAELAGDFISGFKVGVEGGLFDIATARCASGVDVDSGQRFSGIDNDRTAGWQAHFTLEGGFNLGFDLIVAEQRDFAGVQFNFAGEIRTTQRGNVLARQLKYFRVIDQNFTDVLTQVVTEGTHDNVAFLVDQERSRAAFRCFLDGFPVLQTEAQVPLQRFGGFANACGTHDKPHAIRQLEACQRFFQLGTVITFDTARDATRTRVVWHQNQIAPCQADKGC